MLAPFADPRVAERISQLIDAGLATPGARDVTARLPVAGRASRCVDGCTYLLPTIVLCESSEHPLANREFLFPFAAVVTVTPTRWRACRRPMGKTLVVIGDHRGSRAARSAARLAARRSAERRRRSPTNQISWDQPHEGNLFEHLYARRSFQAADRRLLPPGPASREDPVAHRRRRQRCTAAAACATTRWRPSSCARGHDVVLMPVYTPTRTDERNVSEGHVFFGGISVYLEQHVADLPPHAATARSAVGRRLGDPAWRRSGRSRSIRRASAS